MSPSPLFPYRAVLFDLDGTLVHNAPYHRQAWQEVALEHLHIALSPEDYALRVDGGRNPEIMERLTGRKPSDAEALAFHDVKEGRYRDLARGRLEALPGAQAYLDWLEQHGVPYALVTSADAVNVEFVFEQIGLGERFARRIIGSDVQSGKPHPEPYLRGAALLGVNPAHCLVHEDAINGVTSGVAAGCTVCAVTSHLGPQPLLEAGAAFTVPDFAVWLEGFRAASQEPS